MTDEQMKLAIRLDEYMDTHEFSPEECMIVQTQLLVLNYLLDSFTKNREVNLNDL